MTFAPGHRIGRYEVVRKLGQGGFGVLYVARDTELDREVALKFLRKEHVTRHDVVQRFLREARSAAKINHPGIVTVFECGQMADADGTVFIAMELLHGESLAQRLKRGQLAPALAINIVRQVCSALMAAHLASIVHRDLKPDNLFLVDDPAVRGGIRVKVLDFGIAKLADGQFAGGVQTHSALVLGTPMYMSPEQCKSSAKVDHRSDIYALGCILYQLVCGTTPYTGDAGELIAKHQLAPVPDPRLIAPELPAALDALLTQMLAKAPDARPESMEVVESALATMDRSEALFPSPIETADTTMSEAAAPSRKWMFAGGAGVVALGVVLAIVTSRGGDLPVPPPPRPRVAIITLDAAVLAIDAAPAPVVVAEVPVDAPPPAPDAGVVAIASPPPKPTTRRKPAVAPPVETCDARTPKAKGDDYVANGMDTAALAQFEASLRCKNDPQVVRLAFMSACKAKNASAAKKWWLRVQSNPSSLQLGMICKRAGIALD